MVVLYIIGKLFTKEPSAKNEAERMYRSFKTKEEGINGSTTIAPKKNCLPDNCPLDNCPQEKFPPDLRKTMHCLKYYNIQVLQIKSKE